VPLKPAWVLPWRESQAARGGLTLPWGEAGDWGVKPTLIFLPCQAPPRPMGRVAAAGVPAAGLAVVTHAGPHAGIDLAYGTLAAYVTRHALAVDGSIREYYLTGPIETPDQAAWRTEIGWPIFATAPLPPAKAPDH